MTVLDALKKRIDMPKKVWDYKVFGPTSMDDDFTVSGFIQRTEKSKKVWFHLNVKDFDLEITK